MTDPTPPPEEPLGDQARARIRSELLQAAQARPSGSRRWAVPVAAAASVALVAGVTAWAVSGSDTGRADRNGPATSTSATSAPVPTEPGPDTPTSDETTPPSEQPTGEPQPEPSPNAGVGGTCPGELEHVIKGAERAAVFAEEDGGTTTYWVKGDRFVLCDERAGTTTVHQPLPLEPDLDDVATFRVSSLFPSSKEGFRVVRVAGGLVPEGALAFDVDYTFPDGHTARAAKVTDDQGRTWWRMVYAYDDGGGNELDERPIEVSVTLSGSGFGFTLEWGVDTCAQANHGC